MTDDTSPIIRKNSTCVNLYGLWVFLLTITGVILLTQNSQARHYALTVFLPVYLATLLGLLLGYCCYRRAKRVTIVLPSDLTLQESTKQVIVEEFQDDISKEMDTGMTLRTMTTGELTPEKKPSWDVMTIVETVSDHFATVLFPPRSMDDEDIPTPIQSDSDFDDYEDEKDFDPEAQNQPIDMTGTYKMVHSIDYDEFLKALHVPWAMRRAAAAARPTHVITHVGDTFRIQIEGIIKSDTTFYINGEGVETRIRSMKFWDTLTYLDSGDGVQTHKVATDMGESTSNAKEIFVTRQLNKGGGVLVMCSKAVFPDGSETKEAVQTFDKIK